jgi:hypothetical protein
MNLTGDFIECGGVQALRLSDGSLWVRAMPSDDRPKTSDHKGGQRQLRGWRTVKQLAEELQFPSEKACRAWLSRQGIVSVRRGRVILVDGLDIDRAIRK